MASFTIQDLVDRAASIADMDGNFVEPIEWIRFYNVEARALDLFMLRHGYVHVAPEAVTADSSDNYSIDAGTDYSAVLGVYEVRDGKYRPLRYVSPVEFYTDDRASSPSSAPRGDAQVYTIEEGASTGLKVHLRPVPSSGTYRGLFYPDAQLSAPVTPSLDDSVSWPMGAEERIVLGMARRALIKEESDPRPMEALMREEDQRIEELCWSRAYADSPRVRNTDRTNRGWSAWYDTMPYGAWDTWTWI